MKTLITATAALLILAGCSSGGSAKVDTSSAQALASAISSVLNSTPKCADWATHTVTLEEAQQGCVEGTTINMTGIHECKDGRQLYWNDWGWGYIGAKATAHAAGAERVAPAAERTACGY